MSELIDLGFRAIWEPYEVQLKKDMLLSESSNDYDYYDHYDCQHVKNGRVPNVVIGLNEGGHNSVGICANCLLAALKGKLNAQTPL